MSIWALATHIAIWTLIAGSLAVFGWFLIAVVRLARSATGNVAGQGVDGGADQGAGQGADHGADHGADGAAGERP